MNSRPTPGDASGLDPAGSDRESWIAIGDRDLPGRDPFLPGWLAFLLASDLPFPCTYNRTIEKADALASLAPSTPHS